MGTRLWGNNAYTGHLELCFSLPAPQAGWGPDARFVGGNLEPTEDLGAGWEGGAILVASKATCCPRHLPQEGNLTIASLCPSLPLCLQGAQTLGVPVCPWPYVAQNSVEKTRMPLAAEVRFCQSH